MEQKDKDFFSDIVERIKNLAKNTPDHTENYEKEDIQKNKDLCILSYLGILFVIPLIVSRNSKFSRFHVNQGLILFLSEIVLSAATGVGRIYPFRLFPFSMFSGIVSAVYGLIVLYFVVVGILNAVNGKAKELPIIGKIRFIN